MGASQERHGAGALPVFVIRVRASSYKFQVVNDRLWPVIPLDLDMMTVTGAPRSRSPDIELGTYTSGFVILRQAVILCQLTCRPTASPQPIQRGAIDSTDTSPPPPDGPSRGPGSYLPSYSYDALHHAKPQLQSLPSRLPSPLPPLPAPESDASIGVAHPNVADGNYGDPSDRLFSVYLAQADKFDKEQSESWKGDTEGILVFVCHTTVHYLALATNSA